MSARHSGVRSASAIRKPAKLLRRNRGSRFPDEGTLPDRGKTPVECKRPFQTNDASCSICPEGCQETFAPEVLLGYTHENLPRPCRLTPSRLAEFLPTSAVRVITPPPKDEACHACCNWNLPVTGD